MGGVVIGMSTSWETVKHRSRDDWRRGSEPARGCMVPCAIRLYFDSGSVWFVAALPMSLDLDEIMAPGDQRS